MSIYESLNMAEKVIEEMVSDKKEPIVGGYQTVIVHRSSHDSSAAAWMFTQLTSDNQYGNIRYHVTDYKVFDFDTHMPDLNAKDLILIDIYYPTATMEMLLKLAKSVTVISCKLIPHMPQGVIIKNDFSICSAEIAHKILFGNKLSPWWIKYLHNLEVLSWLPRDLESEQFNAAMNHRVSIHNFDVLEAMSEDTQEEFLGLGQQILEVRYSTIVNRCAYASVAMLSTKIGDFNVVAVDSRKYRERIAKHLCSENAIAVVYYADYVNQSILGRCPIFNDTAITPNYVRVQKFVHRYNIKIYGSPHMMIEHEINLGQIARTFGGDGDYCRANFIYYGDLRSILTC